MARTIEDNKKVLEKTAEQLNISQHTVHEIVRLYMGMVRNDISSAEFQNSILMGFGKFVVKEKNKEKRLAHIAKKEKEKCSS